MNIGRGLSSPQDNEFPFMGSWVPSTPEKFIPTRSNPGYQFGGENWQEMAGTSNGFLQEVQNYNAELHNSNVMAQMGCSSRAGSIPEKNQMINYIAGSGIHTLLQSDSTDWNQPLEKLFLGNMDFVSSTNRTLNRSIIMAANRPLVPNPHSPNFIEFENLLVNQHSCSNPISGTENMPFETRIQHRQIESNEVGSYMGNNMMLGNRDHSSGSISSTNSSYLNHRNQYGYPMPSRPTYDLNSVQRVEANNMSNIANLVPVASITPQQAKMGSNQISSLLNFPTNERSSLEMEKQHIITSGIEETQQQCDGLLQNIVESLSAAISTPYKISEDLEKVSDEGIDLNKTPQQKTPKRRKHRPKVIRERKPRKTSKPATTGPAKEKPLGKRKYVRRKGLKEAATPAADVQESKVSIAKTAAKSCRRALNFDMEKTGDKGECRTQDQGETQERNRRSREFISDFQVTELYTGRNGVCSTSSNVQIGQQNGLMVEKSPTGPQSSSSVVDHLQNGYISQPKSKGFVNPLHLTTSMDQQVDSFHAGRILNKGNTDPCQDRSKHGYTPTQQHILAESRWKLVNQAKRINDCGKPRDLNSNSIQPLVPPPQSSSEERGSKRAYPFAIEHTHTGREDGAASLLLYQEILQAGHYQQNGSNFGGISSDINKKKKYENRGVYANVRGISSCVTANGVSEKDDTKSATTVTLSGCTSEIKQALVNHQAEGNGSKKRRYYEVRNFTGDQNIHLIASGYNLPQQQFLPELQPRAQRKERTNVSTQVDKHNLHPPSPLTNVPTQGIVQTHKAYDVSILKKEATSLKSSKFSSSNRMQDEYAMYRYQQSIGQTKGSPIDDIIWRLKSLDLNEKTGQMVGQEQNAIVPYKGGGAIVPSVGSAFIKKRKPRPKVDLDPDTERIWNLLMGKEGSEGHGGTDREKEKWWEEERNVFRGRADSFIARMHLVQGDRRFSRWKGSVVDSVIGVFLTQNVSDHLSSSAFMSLAARFPQKSTGKRSDEAVTNVLIKEPEICTPISEETIQWFQGPVEPRLTMTINSINYQRHNPTSGIGKRLVEPQNHSVEEEVISSQDSFDSSITQCIGVRSSSGSNSEAEEFPTGYSTMKNHVQTLQVEKTTFFQEFFNILNGSASNETSEHEAWQLKDTEQGSPKSGMDKIDDLNGPFQYTSLDTDSLQMQVLVAPSNSYNLNIAPDSGIQEVEGGEAFSEESTSSWPAIASAFTTTEDFTCQNLWSGEIFGIVDKTKSKQNELPRSQETAEMHLNESLSKNAEHMINVDFQSSSNGTGIKPPPTNGHERNQNFQAERTSSLGHSIFGEELGKGQTDTVQYVHAPKQIERIFVDVERIPRGNNQMQLADKLAGPNSKEQAPSSQANEKTNTSISKLKQKKAESEKNNVVDWDSLRKQVEANGREKERSKDAMDSLDYEAVRLADVHEISNAIKERGMNNLLAERIKGFLNRLVEEHGSIDLEWLRDVPPDKAKDYLLSMRGLGLKSVECVRLLTLHHLAFPVDTNVGRIAVRLGWVPLQPLPESLQLHLLELYPVLESIQKYLWPRLCKLDQRTLYELHYQLITFGKVFCTKNKPNCNACPMRGECRHFASAFASARLALPGPEEKGIVTSASPIPTERLFPVAITPLQLPSSGKRSPSPTETDSEAGKCEPIIEVPATPEQEYTEISESDIEDSFYEDPDEIPTIKLSMEEFKTTLQNYIPEGDMSKALVALNTQAASIPTPKLKNVSRLRTEHQVYELPDSHPLLEGMDRREPDDPSPYLLAIWTPGETADSIQPPEISCGSQDPNRLCNEKTCFSCNSIREANTQTVRGTILIPCRTAMRGSFPLNGTYFQVNEVFADHDSSLHPIDVPRAWIWKLPRRTVYFGTSVSTIFKGLSTEGIQYCFWRGFVCVRGFDQKTRAPRPLIARLHFPASKLAKTKNGVGR